MPWGGADAWANRWPGQNAAPTTVPKNGQKAEGAPSAKLFVGCLPYSKTEADLEVVFSQFGPLVEVAILKDGTGASKGAGFVTYQDETSAVTAMSYLQGHILEGAMRGMNIAFATSSGGPRPGGGGGCRGGAPPRPLQVPAGGGASLPGCKLFVGQLPYSRTEADLMQLFGSIGPVTEVCLLKDKVTQEKKGAAFVRYSTPQHAAAAAASLNGFLFSGSTRPITVSLAQNDTGGSPMPNMSALASLGTLAGGGTLVPVQQKRPAGPGYMSAWSKAPDAGAMAIESEPGAKLFVGQLPFSRNEEDLRQVFSQYGPVVEVLLHRDVQGQKKGGAFVRYQSAAHATAALDLDGYLFQGSTRPITVSIAGEGGAKRRRMD